MWKLYFKSVKTKIIALTLLCVICVGGLSNAIIYAYMGNMIVEKAILIDEINLDHLGEQIDQRVQSAFSLVVMTASNTTVNSATVYPDLSSVAAKRAAIDAQELLNAYLISSTAEQYADKFLVTNTSGLIVQAAGNTTGDLTDQPNAFAQSVLQEALRSTTTGSVQIDVSHSVAYPNQYALCFACPLFATSAVNSDAAVYLELNIAALTDLLAPFSDTQNIFIASEQEQFMLTTTGEMLPLDDLYYGLADGDTFVMGGTSYQLHVVPLDDCNFSLYGYTDVSWATDTNYQVTVVIVVVAITCILLGLLLAIVLSNYITQPMNLIIARIRRICQNDFSYDPSIEQSGDEFGEIGKVVNEMVLSVDNLVHQTQSMSEQRKNIEIALLQSQVNPHFLYNTLDSVYWMAVLQKNTNVANMTRSLVNLLKSIAKGTQSKITLQEELSLLNDYVHIQSVRYLETFEFICEVPEHLLSYQIIKLTLQPLVENAIFHGIVPTGKNGTIRLTASEGDDFVSLVVSDNGIGISAEKLKNLLSPNSERKREKVSMSGIGLANVDTRLKLTYGMQYGLSIESTEHEFTKISVKIPKETV